MSGKNVCALLYNTKQCSLIPFHNYQIFSISRQETPKAQNK